jgi:hypothetical protein
MSDTHLRGCPCKRIPLYLSSFTAAEHGNLDLSSLAHLKNISSRSDSAGNTPLHLAAQHGHVNACVALLDAGCHVNACKSGATPLHRASFSGAVATMQLLLQQQQCDLLCQDTSFSDLRTPLHKSVAGGRYLAVQLLVEELRARSLLEQALLIQDSNRQTPFQLASELQYQGDDLRQSVARWNSVAGGSSDWLKCFQLVERVQGKFTIEPSRPTGAQHNVPAPLDVLTADCANCDDGNCNTASWEKAFRSALNLLVDERLQGSRTSTKETKLQSSSSLNPDSALTVNDVFSMADSTPYAFPICETQQLGRKCDLCQTLSFALYPKDVLLVCKACRKRKISSQHFV